MISRFSGGKKQGEMKSQVNASKFKSDYAPTTEASPLRAIYIYVSILILFVNYFLAQYDKFILSYFQDSFSAGLSLSTTQYALLSGYAPGIVYALAAIPVAFLSDYFPNARVWTLTIAALWWSLCVVFQSLSKNFAQVFLARLGMGLGQAAVGPLSISLISDMRSLSGSQSPQLEEPGKLSTLQIANVFVGGSVFYVGVYVGEAISGQIATAFRDTESGWRIALRAIGITGLVVAVILRLWIREPKRYSGLIEHELLREGEESSVKVDYPVQGSKLRAAKLQFRNTVRYVARLESFWLIVLSASMRQLAGNVFGYYMPSYLSNMYPSESNLLSRYGIIAGVVGSVSCLSGGLLTAVLWKRTKMTPLYLTAIGGMVSSLFVLLMIFSLEVADGNETDGVRILYGMMSAAYITAETWLGILEVLVALLLPAASKTFGLAIYESVQVLIYSSGPEIIGLALRNTDSGTQEYTRITQIALAVIIVVGYWLCGFGLLVAIPLVRRDLSAEPVQKPISRSKKMALWASLSVLLAFVVALFIASIVIDSS